MGLLDGLETHRQVERRLQRTRRHPAGQPRAAAVVGDDVAASGRKSRARAAVAEADRHRAVVGQPRGVDLVRGALAEQGRHLRPEDVVDQHGEGGVDAAGAGAGRVRQGLLLQLERLERHRGVAVAEDLVVHLLAVAGPGHVAEQRRRGGLELERRLGLQGEGEVLLDGRPGGPGQDEKPRPRHQHARLLKGGGDIGGADAPLEQAASARPRSPAPSRARWSGVRSGRTSPRAFAAGSRPRESSTGRRRAGRRRQTRRAPPGRVRRPSSGRWRSGPRRAARPARPAGSATCRPRAAPGSEELRQRRGGEAPRAVAARRRRRWCRRQGASAIVRAGSVPIVTLSSGAALVSERAVGSAADRRPSGPLGAVRIEPQVERGGEVVGCGGDGDVEPDDRGGGDHGRGARRPAVEQHHLATGIDRVERQPDAGGVGVVLHGPADLRGPRVDAPGRDVHGGAADLSRVAVAPEADAGALDLVDDAWRAGP